MGSYAKIRPMQVPPIHTKTKSHVSARLCLRRWLWAAGLAVVLAGAGGYAVAAWQSTHVNNFAVVIPGELCRSAQPSAEQFQALLHDYKIGTVISFRTEEENTLDPRAGAEASFLRSRGIAFRQLPTSTPPSAQQFHAFLDAMHDPALPRPILVHCAAGRVRTGACVALWRILHQGWPVEQALEDARRFGLKDDPTIAAVRQFQAEQRNF